MPGKAGDHAAHHLVEVVLRPRRVEGAIQGVHGHLKEPPLLSVEITGVDGFEHGFEVSFADPDGFLSRKTRSRELTRPDPGADGLDVDTEVFRCVIGAVELPRRGWPR